MLSIRLSNRKKRVIIFLILTAITLVVFIFNFFTYEHTTLNFFGKDLKILIPTRVVFRDKISWNTKEQKNFEDNLRNMHKSIRDNIKYPREEVYTGKAKIVEVEFRVTKTGELVGIKIHNSASKLLDEEALRVFTLCPKWNPIIVNGEPVDEILKIPILFVPIPPSPKEP